MPGMDFRNTATRAFDTPGIDFVDMYRQAQTREQKELLKQMAAERGIETKGVDMTNPYLGGSATPVAGLSNVSVGQTNPAAGMQGGGSAVPPRPGAPMPAQQGAAPPRPGAPTPAQPSGMPDPFEYREAVQKNPQLLEQNKQGWLAAMEAVMQKPGVAQALLGFGAQTLQAAGQGQTTASAIGQGVQAGTQAYNQAMQRQTQNEMNERRLDQNERQIEQTDRRIDLQEAQFEEGKSQWAANMELKKRELSTNEMLADAQKELTDAKINKLGRSDENVPASVAAARALAQSWVAIGEYDDPNVAYSEAVSFLKGTSSMNRQTFKAEITKKMMDLVQLRMMGDDNLSEQEFDQMQSQLQGMTDRIVESVYGPKAGEGTGNPRRGQQGSGTGGKAGGSSNRTFSTPSEAKQAVDSGNYTPREGDRISSGNYVYRNGGWIKDGE